MDKVYKLDPRSLNLFRIILGLVAFYDIYLNLSNWEALFSPSGVLRYAGESSILNSPPFFLLGLLCSFFIIIGFKTRIFVFLTWFIVLNIQVSNPYLLNFGDQVLLLSLFWSCFLNFDRKSPTILNLGIIFQFLALYLFSFYHKYGPTWRVDFTAVWWALKLNFQTPLINFLLSMPLLLKGLTVLVLITESIFAAGAIFFFAKPRLKTFCVFMGIFFHLGIKLTLDHGYFPFICIGLWSLFLPTWFWDKLISKPEFVEDKKSIPLTGVMLFFMALVVWFNLKTTSVALWRLTPKWVDKVGDVLKLHQAWSMYGSDPPRVTTWKIIKGNGEINLLLPKEKYIEKRPSHYLDIYPDQKWTSLLSRIHYPHNIEIYKGIVDYFCERVDKLESVEILHFSQQNNLLKEDAKVLKSGPKKFNCS